MKVGKIAHVAFIVEDIEKASDYYSKLLGIKKWYELVCSSELELYYLGERKNCDVKIWYAGKGHTSIELIQTRGDENIYATFLKRHGEMIHHVQYYVPNLKNAIKAAENEGLKVFQSANFMSKSMRVDYAYVGKSEDSVIFELIEATLPFGIKKGDMPFELLLGRLTGNFKRVK